MNYISKNKILSLILFVIIFTGCAYKQSNTQSRDIGFLKFNKSVHKSYHVVINNSDFLLHSCIPNLKKDQCHNTQDKLYEIQSGNVVIDVFENNTLIMKKEIYLGSSNIKEINLP